MHHGEIGGIRCASVLTIVIGLLAADKAFLSGGRARIFLGVLCLCVAMISTKSQAATTVHYNVTMDLSDPSIFTPRPQNNLGFFTVPLTPTPAPGYGVGNTVDVSLSFVGSQRLLLTAHPTGQSAPFGQQGIGIFVYDNTQPNNCSGSLTGSVSLIDPQGSNLINSASNNISFGAAQGAFDRLFATYTDSTFSVAGFEFQLNIQTLSPATVLPNEVQLELREFQVQSIPEPPAGCLFLAALSAPLICNARRFSRFCRRTKRDVAIFHFPG
ncbi:MAG TPA: hypothetical protein VHS31_06860 [Tepidisphaeraceae bacterium]|nr:hypothetical protein [Tepidisphaeraceae bacterium]